jgi:hypothetical protein
MDIEEDTLKKKKDGIFFSLMIKASFLERGWKSTIWEALFSRNIQEQNWLHE